MFKPITPYASHWWRWDGSAKSYNYHLIIPLILFILLVSQQQSSTNKTMGKEPCYLMLSIETWEVHHMLRNTSHKNHGECIMLHNTSHQNKRIGSCYKMFPINWTKFFSSSHGTALDCTSTGRSIKPAPEAWFIPKFISLAQVVPGRV